jgi:hypothetical protein
MITLKNAVNILIKTIDQKGCFISARRDVLEGRSLHETSRIVGCIVPGDLKQTRRKLLLLAASLLDTWVVVSTGTQATCWMNYQQEHEQAVDTLKFYKLQGKVAWIEVK